MLARVSPQPIKGSVDRGAVAAGEKSLRLFDGQPGLQRRLKLLGLGFRFFLRAAPGAQAEVADHAPHHRVVEQIGQRGLRPGPVTGMTETQLERGMGARLGQQTPQEAAEGDPVVRMEQLGDRAADDGVILPVEELAHGRTGVGDHRVRPQDQRCIRGTLQQRTQRRAQVRGDADDPDQRAVTVDAGVGDQCRKSAAVLASHRKSAGPRHSVTQCDHDVGGHILRHLGHREGGDVPPDRFLRSPSVELLGRAIPVQHHTVQVGGDHRLADRGQLVRRLDAERCACLRHGATPPGSHPYPCCHRIAVWTGEIPEPSTHKSGSGGESDVLNHFSRIAILFRLPGWGGETRCAAMARTPVATNWALPGSPGLRIARCAATELSLTMPEEPAHPSRVAKCQISL